MPSKHKLRDARKDADLTQRRLSGRAGVSVSTISNIECHRGPDVPLSERRLTKSKLSTALKLVQALKKMPPGQYSMEDFLANQSIFCEQEMHEKAQRSVRRRLRAVA